MQKQKKLLFYLQVLFDFGIPAIKKGKHSFSGPIKFFKTFKKQNRPFKEIFRKFKKNAEKTKTIFIFPLFICESIVSNYQKISKMGWGTGVTYWYHIYQVYSHLSNKDRYICPDKFFVTNLGIVAP